MPKATYAHCRNCGRHRDEVGLLSRTRLCSECSANLLIENMHGIATKSGVAYQRWRLGGVAGYLGDEITAVLYKSGVFRLPLDESAQGR